MNKSGLCWSCLVDLHRECELHINDDAHDADDFISVKCDCHCQGEVYPDHKLIDIIAELRDAIASNQKRHAADDQEARRAVRALREVASLLDAAVDEEGTLINFSPARRWERHVTRARTAIAAALVAIDGGDTQICTTMQEEDDETTSDHARVQEDTPLADRYTAAASALQRSNAPRPRAGR